MRGPIDYIIVGFQGNKFDGSVLKALGDAIEKGIIALVDLSLITKDESGQVSTVNIADLGDTLAVDFAKKYKPAESSIAKDDIDEMADLLENNTASGMLVIEHIWAIPLKKALIDAGGVLVADGRIHPDAAVEINDKGGK